MPQASSARAVLSNLFLDFLNNSLKIHQTCLLCGQRCQDDFCSACEQDWQRQHQQCPQKNVAPLQQITAAFPYHWPLARLVQQFKYHRQLTLAAPLARLMHRYLPPLSPDFAPDFLVPIPLHPQRFAKRGFNQSAELALQLGHLRQIPVSFHCLARTIATPSQVGLNAQQRQHNLGHAFAVSCPVAGQKIVLIDDVMTTGTTLAQAAKTLLAAGAKQVDAWVFASTPAHFS